MFRTFAPRRGIRRATLALLFFGCAPSASAVPLTAPTEPLAIVASASERPACEDRFAPRAAGPLEILRDGDNTEFVPSAATTDEERSVEDEFAAVLRRIELRPAITICSPSFAGLPGAPTGTTAEPLNRTRVGPGWREIGASGITSAALRAGDKVELPAVDALTSVRVHVAAESGGATALVTFTDLGVPATLSVGADERGVLVRLVRHGGATTEQIVQPPRVPKSAVQLSGTFRSWELATQQLPGSAVTAGLDDQEAVAMVRASSNGTARMTLPYLGGTSERPKELWFFSSTFDAQTLAMTRCQVSVKRRTTPKLGACQQFSGVELLGDLFGALIAIEDELPIARPGQAGRADASRRLESLKRLVTRTQRQAAATRDAAAEHSASTTTAPRAEGLGIDPARLAARQQAAPIPAKEPRLARLQRSPAMVKLKAYAVLPLQHDLNGDGKPEFWSELGGYTGRRSERRKLAGYLFISSPAGLTPRRVVIPDANRESLGDSELSTIADVTGDGLAELVVDLDERHAIIPGSRTLAARTGAIVVRGETGVRHLIVEPSLSSPGAPYGAVDDVTGDGRRELAVVDDTSAAMTIPSERLAVIGPLRVPGGTGRVQASTSVWERHRDSYAPKGDPAVRVIAGRIVTTGWEPSTPFALGKATFSVLDARGNAVQPPVTLTTTGDASLLDYDRRTGDLLVWISPDECGTRECGQAVARVAPDGSIKQLLQRGPSMPLVASSARFMEDGPDADGELEIVFSRTYSGLGFAASTLRGTLHPQQLGRLEQEAVKLGRRWYALTFPVRAIPLVAADGSRTTVLRATRLYRHRSGYLHPRYPDIDNAPLALRW